MKHLMYNHRIYTGYKNKEKQDDKMRLNPHNTEPYLVHGTIRNPESLSGRMMVCEWSKKPVIKNDTNKCLKVLISPGEAAAILWFRINV